MTRAKSKLAKSARAKRSNAHAVRKAPFMEHISELRKRLFRIVASVVVFSAGAYFVQQYIVAALLDPAEGQQFAQTTPGGGIDFLFRVCLYTGIAISVPVIFQQVLGYLSPLIKKDATRFITRVSVASWVLAVGGILFGYFIGLPAAMHFLLHQFQNPQIETLISLQSYLSFVMMYLLGASILFQVPLIMLVVNHIKPLKPKKLLRYERWVIVIAFVLGGLLSPSPNISDQVLLAGPLIATYQLGIGLVWFVNRRSRRPKKVLTLLEQDEAARQKRLAEFAAARQALSAQFKKTAAATTPKQPQSAITRRATRSPAPSGLRPVRTALSSNAIPSPSTTANAHPGTSRPYMQTTFERRSYFSPVPGRVQ